MSDTIRTWKLTVNCHTASSEEFVTFTHEIESTGVPQPNPYGQFLNWNTNGLIISYNSSNVHSWTMEETFEHD